MAEWKTHSSFFKYMGVSDELRWTNIFVDFQQILYGTKAIKKKNLQYRINK
jgi:hypothetical protein